MKKKLVSLFSVALLSAAVVAPVFAQEFDAEVEETYALIAKEEAAKEAKAAAEKAAAEAEKQAEKELVEKALASLEPTTEPKNGALLEVLPDGSKVRVEPFDSKGNKLSEVVVGKAGLVKEEAKAEDKKAEDKKEEAKPAAKAVAKADTKTAEKVLPKTSAVK